MRANLRRAALTGLIACSAPLAAQQVEIDSRGELKFDGLWPDATRTARLVVREWATRDTDQTASAASEVNTVGSIVEVATPTGEGLALAWDSTDSPWQVTIAHRDEDTRQLTQTLDGDWRLDATVAALDGVVRIEGTLLNLAAESRPERPITMGLAIDIPDAERLSWLRDLRQRSPLAGSPELIETVPTTAGALGTMSRYPFAAIGDGENGLAVGLPLDQPRIHRVRWDGRKNQLVAEIDVAVSALPVAMRNKVPFTFLVYPFDDSQGFRAAAQHYYALNEPSYEVRLARQGQWMPFTQVDTVERVEDFAFVFHEYHPNVSVAYNNANGIESLVYCEPPVQYVSLTPEQPRDVEFLGELIEGLDTVQGSQLRTSATRDRAGAMPVAWVETPWAVGGRIPTNGNPDVARSEANRHNSFDANWLPYLDLYRRRGDDAPRAWQGGRRVDGALGMNGLALVLGPGESTSQRIRIDSSDTAPLLALQLAAVASNKATLKVRLEPADAAAIETSTTVIGDGFAVRRELPLGDRPVPAGEYSLTLTAGDDMMTLDDIALMGASLANAGFEEGVLDAEAVTGVYLDSFEGWDSPQLNFRRDHLESTRLPLTFDAQTGATAQVVMMHNFELADEMLRRLRARGHTLMANTALYQWAWSAHYLDVLGIETSWGETATISPPRIDELDYLRTMLYHKPYCYLQNVQYANFRGDKVRDYFALCFHYGLWPGFFSHNAAESPYWQDPALYNADRRWFLHFMRPQQRLTAAGWEPVTLATANDSRVMVERWGGGPLVDATIQSDALFYTQYNPTASSITYELALDPPARAGEGAIAFDLLTGSRLMVNDGGRVLGLHLQPRAAAAVMLIAQRDDALAAALTTQAEDVAFLADKYRRFGLVDADLATATAEAAMALDHATLVDPSAKVAAALTPEYTPEWRRSMRLFEHLASARAELAEPTPLRVEVPPTLVRGARARFAVAQGAMPGDEYSLEFDGPDGPVLYALPADGIEVPVPRAWSMPTMRATLRRTRNGAERLVFEGVLPIDDRLGWSHLPELATIRGEGMASLMLHNNSDDAYQGEVSVAAPEGLVVEAPPRVAIAPRSQHLVAVRLIDQRPDRSRDLRAEVGITVGADTDDATTARLPLSALASDASLLRGPGVAVRVDSFYFGYDLKALNDGIVDPEGMGWAEVAWASGDGMVPHWVEFVFDQPTELGEVAIHWAPDSGTHMTSREVAIQLAGASGEWETVATHRATGVEPVSTIRFDRREAHRLRLYQPTGAGSAARPGLMWLMEVEAR